MRKHFLGAAALAITTALASPAQALFGIGDIVYDPANHAENVLTAAQTLQQLNNQVVQLANEAQMLLNQANNLAVLPSSVSAELQGSLAEIDTLIRTARGLAYEVDEIDREFRRLFPDTYADGAASSAVIADADEAWALAREGLKHSLEVQASVTDQVRADTTTLDTLLAESQSASGNLQALQAGNQLTALSAKQTMQLQTLVAASSRAAALERADALSERERARARFARFMGGSDAYPSD